MITRWPPIAYICCIWSYARRKWLCRSQYGSYAELDGALDIAGGALDAPYNGGREAGIITVSAVYPSPTSGSSQRRGMRIYSPYDPFLTWIAPTAASGSKRLKAHILISYGLLVLYVMGNVAVLEYVS